MFILGLFGIVNSNAQNYEAYESTKFFELTVPTFIEEIKDSPKQILAEAKLKFTVLKIDKDGNYIIQFWNWSNSTDRSNLEKMALYIYNDINKKKNGIISNDINNLKFFKITSEDFKSNSIPYYNAGLNKGSFDWSSGLILLPVKTRNLPSFTYSKDLSLGLSGGGKMRISHRNPTYLNLLINVGLSSVTIDSLSSNGKLAQPSDLAAFTTSIGVVLENHSFQFGIFYGVDKLSANDFRNTTWIYNKKPWLSLGLGYQILSSGDKNKNKNPGNQ